MQNIGFLWLISSHALHTKSWLSHTLCKLSYLLGILKHHPQFPKQSLNEAIKGKHSRHQASTKVVLKANLEVLPWANILGILKENKPLSVRLTKPPNGGGY